MAGEGLANGLAADGVPQPHGPVPATAGEQVALADLPERDPVHPAGVGGKDVVGWSEAVAPTPVASAAGRPPVSSWFPKSRGQT